MASANRNGDRPNGTKPRSNADELLRRLLQSTPQDDDRVQREREYSRKMEALSHRVAAVLNGEDIYDAASVCVSLLVEALAKVPANERIGLIAGLIDLGVRHAEIAGERDD